MNKDSSDSSNNNNNNNNNSNENNNNNCITAWASVAFNVSMLIIVIFQVVKVHRRNASTYLQHLRGKRALLFHNAKHSSNFENI